MEEIAEEERRLRMPDRRIVIGYCPSIDTAPIIERFREEEARAAQPDYRPGTVRGNGRRELLTTPSGNFTYPEPKRRRRK